MYKQPFIICAKNKIDLEQQEILLPIENFINGNDDLVYGMPNIKYKWFLRHLLCSKYQIGAIRVYQPIEENEIENKQGELFVFTLSTKNINGSNIVKPFLVSMKKIGKEDSKELCYFCEIEYDFNLNEFTSFIISKLKPETKIMFYLKE